MSPASVNLPELHALQLSRVVPDAIIEEGPIEGELGDWTMLPEIWQFVVPYGV